MEQLKAYIQETLGDSITFLPINSKELTSSLPFYMGEMYTFYKIILFNEPLILLKPIKEDEVSIMQMSKHQELIQEKLNCKSALVLNEIEAFQRKRLIDKRIQFIVPGKQLFLPFFLLDLNEKFYTKRQKKDKISPSAQVMVLWYLLDKTQKFPFEQHNQRDLAKHFSYSTMGISKAVEELIQHGLCVPIEHGKDKMISFNADRRELWFQEVPLLSNPILKVVYVDQLPDVISHIQSNYSALSEYSDMNPNRQRSVAIDKTIFYGLEKSGKLDNVNDREGEYRIEVWKYNPTLFTELLTTDDFAVDPISLYLSMKEDNHDERTDTALEHLLNNIW